MSVLPVYVIYFLIYELLMEALDGRILKDGVHAQE